ncbi:tetratricopeptide repeat protein [Demequina litorisediminis]|uniref:Co-chaperone YbbN n=1 Tax=Demequina litorisediminis TaxID=1849022 RepID=A0ABQ6IFY7_9MICO|nr:tetratricopeptide repeat protein [Demequina litorisediminis]GMA36695.1 co-chaperone YbbN [Demequina litorisediminis]
MTQNPDVPLRGAPDLSQFAQAAPVAAAGNEAPASAVVPVIEVTEANLNDLAQQSTQVPIVIVFLSSASPASRELVETVRTVAGGFDGRFVVGRCDIDVHGSIAQALQINAVPTVVALIAGRPAPLFQGSADQAQIKEILDQVLEVAQQHGVTGRVDTAAQAAEPVPEPLPPLHQEAYDAVEREDYDAAIAAYDQALRENPKDHEAKAGRAQVALMSRTRTADLAAVRKAAADAPGDVDAQMDVADLDIMGGQVEDAFARLLDAVRGSQGDDREKVRLRLIELFDVVGAADPRVADARRALSTALF